MVVLDFFEILSYELCRGKNSLKVPTGIPPEKQLKLFCLICVMDFEDNVIQIVNPG